MVLGVRVLQESPYRPGKSSPLMSTISGFFENSVPGLPEAAPAEGLTPLAYMRKYGAFEVARDTYNMHESLLSAGSSTGQSWILSRVWCVKMARPLGWRLMARQWDLPRHRASWNFSRRH